MHFHMRLAECSGLWHTHHDPVTYLIGILPHFKFHTNHQWSQISTRTETLSTLLKYLEKLHD